MEISDQIKKETDPIYQKVSKVIPEVEWAFHAPLIHKINILKKQKNAVVLAHNYQTPEIFHAVAEAGSFTNATINLNLSQSAISRQIQSLEQDLKVQLFERHARGLTLTENGEYVFKTAHEVITKLKEVETSLGDQKNKPSGKLTITTVRSFGTHWLTPRIQEFMRLNPEIEIELVFDDKELDLSTRQADIGIFMRRPKQLNYIQKKLVDIKYYIYGSNKYL